MTTDICGLPNGHFCNLTSGTSVEIWCDLLCTVYIAISLRIANLLNFYSANNKIFKNLEMMAYTCITKIQKSKFADILIP